MRYFNYSKLNELKLDIKIVNLLTSIYEAKGRQNFYLSTKPQELDRLVEIAKIQSTEASNAIEGIRTTNTRLKQLALDKTTPKNRDEEEILGYRDALNTIHESFKYIPLTPNYILQLHKIMFQHVQMQHLEESLKTHKIIKALTKTEMLILFLPLTPMKQSQQ